MSSTLGVRSNRSRPLALLAFVLLAAFPWPAAVGPAAAGSEQQLDWARKQAQEIVDRMKDLASKSHPEAFYLGPALKRPKELRTELTAATLRRAAGAPPAFASGLGDAEKPVEKLHVACQDAAAAPETLDEALRLLNDRAAKMPGVLQPYLEKEPTPDDNWFSERLFKQAADEAQTIHKAVQTASSTMESMQKALESIQKASKAFQTFEAKKKELKDKIGEFDQLTRELFPPIEKLEGWFKEFKEQSKALDKLKPELPEAEWKQLTDHDLYASYPPARTVREALVFGLRGKDVLAEARSAVRTLERHKDSNGNEVQGDTARYTAAVDAYFDGIARLQEDEDCGSLLAGQSEFRKAAEARVEPRRDALRTQLSKVAADILEIRLKYLEKFHKDDEGILKELDSGLKKAETEDNKTEAQNIRRVRSSVGERDKKTQEEIGHVKKALGDFKSARDLLFEMQKNLQILLR